jgi:hypothetical protein
MARDWPTTTLRLDPRDRERVERRAKAAGMSPHAFMVKVLVLSGSLVDPLEVLREAHKRIEGRTTGDPAGGDSGVGF